MKYLLIGGTFDDNGGKPSGFMKKLFEDMSVMAHGSVRILNGGYFSALNAISVKDILQSYDVIVWFPYVPNKTKSKLIGKIKRIHQKCILISSKFNSYDNYKKIDIIARALQSKSNLIVEFRKDRNSNKYTGKIIDPLGNVFLDICDEINYLAASLMKRINELFNFTRVGSVPMVTIETGLAVPPDKPAFFKIARKYANEFHKLIHTSTPTRFLGNLSFRCTKGFPSFRGNENMIYVSRRNIDKREITRESFVPVNIQSEENVLYFGDHKPSVDTPIQIKLYKYYYNIKYMIHSHLYIGEDFDRYGEIENTGSSVGAAYVGITKSIIPCGAMEEFYEIVEKFPYRGIKEFFINLRGHGSIAATSSLDRLQKINYMTRGLL